MKLLRAFDRWVARNTLLAYWLGLLLFLMIFLAAHKWDVSETTTLRQQMIATRSST